jgi:hypothetical protein
MTALIDNTSPIVGAYSLTLTSTGGSDVAYLTPTNVSGLTKGIEQGRLRTLTRPRSTMTNGYGFGLVCMGSADNIGTSNGDFYRFEFFSTGSYGLVRANGNTLATGTPGTVLISSTATTLTVNTIYSMEMEWVADQVNLGGVYISLKKGTATNFSDLALLSQLTDSNYQQLITSAGEGIYLRGYTSVSEAKVSFDNTQLFLLA